jgi:hypothetical protein
LSFSTSHSNTTEKTSNFFNSEAEQERSMFSKFLKHDGDQKTRDEEDSIIGAESAAGDGQVGQQPVDPQLVCDRMMEQ